MTIYRFRLDSLTCHAKASPDDYADTVQVTLAARIGDEKIGPISSPLGRRGNKLDIYFGPGATHKFDGTYFSAGTWRDWVLEWDMAEDETRDVVIDLLVVNDRGIDDPYALTKLLLSLSFAGALGAAGGAAGAALKDKIAAVILGGVGGVLGEGAKKLFDWLNPKWPTCAPMTVFTQRWELSPAELLREHGRHTSDSIPLVPSPKSCGQPHYTVDYIIEADMQRDYKFAETKKVLQSFLMPMPPPGQGYWLGDWYDSSHPTIAVSIGMSTDSDAASFRITVREEAGNGRKVVVEGTFDAIAETDATPPMWNGPVKPGEAQSSGPVVGKVLGNDTVDMHPKGPRLGGAIGQASGGATAAKATGGTPDVGANQVIGGQVGPINPGGVMPALNLLKGATLRIAAIGVTLVLYEEEEIYGAGRRRLARPFVRYIRDANPIATAADLMLARHSLLR